LPESLGAATISEIYFGICSRRGALDFRAPLGGRSCSPAKVCAQWINLEVGFRVFHEIAFFVSLTNSLGLSHFFCDRRMCQPAAKSCGDNSSSGGAPECPVTPQWKDSFDSPSQTAKRRSVAINAERHGNCHQVARTETSARSDRALRHQYRQADRRSNDDDVLTCSRLPGMGAGAWGLMRRWVPRSSSCWKKKLDLAANH
jgi:hypothetical protein